MKLSQRLWNQIPTYYQKILEHPFLKELQAGTLDRSAFAFYVIQDFHYLNYYARTLSVVGARAPQTADVEMFSHHAAGAIEVERSLHESFLEQFGISQAECQATPLTPTTTAYTSYLLATAYSGSFAEGLAAVLPCYWIYWEVGKHLIAHGSPDPLYQKWIDTYGGDEFGEIVQTVLDLTDRVGQDISEKEVQAMLAHFSTTTKYEWMFWDMGYNQEQWSL